MGGKPDNAVKADRPESGGADKDMIREKSGLLERDKQKFAQEQHEEGKEARANAPESPSSFSIDNPPNSDPRK
ncbi:MAG: hypothetical protein JWL95_565 [Gemmatimonadetes bacterium]|nr:hypothetical protein [Gemmatimonadota bacterium]